MNKVVILIVYVLFTLPLAGWLFLRKRKFSKKINGRITKVLRCRRQQPCTVQYTYTINDKVYNKTETIKRTSFDRICVGPFCHDKLVKGAGISVYVNPTNDKEARLYHTNDDYRLFGGLLAFSSVAFGVGTPFVRINHPRFRGGFGRVPAFRTN
jgi:hypothetical protein